MRRLAAATCYCVCYCWCQAVLLLALGHYQRSYSLAWHGMALHGALFCFAVLWAPLSSCFRLPSHSRKWFAASGSPSPCRISMGWSTSTASAPPRTKGEMRESEEAGNHQKTKDVIFPSSSSSSSSSSPCFHYLLI
jgi:hypothetical protein